jgi:hypothetical protein
VANLTAYLQTIGVQILDPIDKKLDTLLDMKKVVDSLAAEIRAGRRESTIMAAYEDDEKAVSTQIQSGADVIGISLIPSALVRLPIHTISRPAAAAEFEPVTSRRWLLRHFCMNGDRSARSRRTDACPSLPLILSTHCLISNYIQS